MNYTFIEKKPKYEDLNFPNEELQRLVKNINIEELPHLLISGTSGCGKSTHIYSFLNSIFRDDKIYEIKKIFMMKIEEKWFINHRYIILNLIQYN